MKNGLIKSVVCIVTFLVSLFVISAIMNRGNSDLTAEMSEATYPLMYVNYEGQKINCLHGYAQTMDEAFMRDTITPIGTDRKLSFYIDEFNSKVSSIQYEVRSIDGQRLIENGYIYDYKQQDNGISFDVQLKDLIDQNSEYEFITILGTTSSKTIYYYTRIIEQEINYAGEEVQFALDFSNKTLNKESARDIATYLETDETGDNSSFSYVNIHSSFNQITWGNLKVERTTVPQIEINEYFSQTARIHIQYYANVCTETSQRFCKVDEYYRLRYGTQRMYLLNYERMTEEVFDMDQSKFANNKIDLGIRDSAVQMMESEDGGAFAFVSANRLYCYNSGTNKFAQLFAFYTKDQMDQRTVYDDNHIKILNVDETGNVQFAVYGYMNRGNHEGQMGIAVYLYNSISGTIEEEIYVPYEKSYMTLAADLEQLLYMNSNSELFFYLDGTIFMVSTESHDFEIVVDNLSQEAFKVSDSNRMIVWADGKDVKTAVSLSLMNLSNKRISTIQAGEGEYIRPLGFMQEDLIYGLVRGQDVYMDIAGKMILPMYCVHIRNGESNAISMTYEKEGIYVMDVELNDNQIGLSRAVKAGELAVTSTSPDQILSAESETQNSNGVDVVAIDELEKIVQLAAKSNIATKSLKFLTPQQVMYEGDNSLSVEHENQDLDKYYVYGANSIVGVYSKPSDAVECADQIAGTVLNEYGEYVWIKANRFAVNQIMKIKAESLDEDNSSMAVCLNTMLSYVDVNRNSQYLLNNGATALSILRDNVPENTEVLDLSGCSMDSVLYYVNRDLPVMAILRDGSAVLIVGYNELNTVIMDPTSGTIYKKGMNDSAEWFESNGNQFITYIY